MITNSGYWRNAWLLGSCYVWLGSWMSSL